MLYLFPASRSMFLQALIVACIFLLANGFVPLPHSCFSAGPSLNSRIPFQYLRTIVINGGLNDANEEEEEEILYNDFDFVVGDSASSNPSNPAQDALQQRIREQQQQELKEETQLLQNWKTGDWSVRGFSLDPTDAVNDALAENDSHSETNSNPSKNTGPIHVSKVVADANSDGTRIWVGRSDGSVVWVQLGSEYTAYFRSKVSGQFLEGGNSNTPQFKSELVRDSSNDESSSIDAPFQILAQFSPSVGENESPISTILSIPDEDCIFTACEGSGQVKQWHVSEENIGSERPALQTPLPLSEGIHTDTVVALKTVTYQEKSLLLSVSAEGTMALWDIPKGDLISHCRINAEAIMEQGEQFANFDETQSRVIECADVDESHIFLGTTSGCVLAYDVSDLIASAGSPGNDCPLPKGKFKAHVGAVTALACGGPGSLGRVGGAGAAQETSSILLITGGSDGLVKQWEMMSRPSMQKMEHWPKLASQRLPKKAHLFEGHDGSITALDAMGGRRPQFLSASVDGTIRVWNAAEGRESYRMDGFTKDLASLCLLGRSDSSDDLLVTGGMNQYVCIHDFSQGLAGDSIDDYLDPSNE